MTGSVVLDRLLEHVEVPGHKPAVVRVLVTEQQLRRALASAEAGAILPPVFEVACGLRARRYRVGAVPPPDGDMTVSDLSLRWAVDPSVLRRMIARGRLATDASVSPRRVKRIAIMCVEKGCPLDPPDIEKEAIHGET